MLLLKSIQGHPQMLVRLSQLLMQPLDHSLLLFTSNPVSQLHELYLLLLQPLFQQLILLFQAIHVLDF